MARIASQGPSWAFWKDGVNVLWFWAVWGLAWADQNYTEAYLEARSIQQDWLNLWCHMAEKHD